MAILLQWTQQESAMDGFIVITADGSSRPIPDLQLEAEQPRQPGTCLDILIQEQTNKHIHQHPTAQRTTRRYPLPTAHVKFLRSIDQSFVEHLNRLQLLHL